MPKDDKLKRFKGAEEKAVRDKYIVKAIVYGSALVMTLITVGIVNAAFFTADYANSFEANLVKMPLISLTSITNHASAEAFIKLQSFNKDCYEYSASSLN